MAIVFNQFLPLVQKVRLDQFQLRKEVINFKVSESMSDFFEMATVLFVRIPTVLFLKV